MSTKITSDILITIRKILSLTLEDDSKLLLILQEISRHPNSVTLVLHMIQKQNESTANLMKDMNFLLSKSDTYLSTKNKEFKEGEVECSNEIKEFYLKHKEELNQKGLGHCFKNIYEN